MSDIERCDICGNPMSLDESPDATVCNSTRCYTSVVRARAAARGVTFEQVLKDDPALAAGLEIAKAVQPVGLFEEESGDEYAEGKMADLAANGGTVGDTYIPPVKQSHGYVDHTLYPSSFGAAVIPSAVIGDNPQLLAYLQGMQSQLGDGVKIERIVTAHHFAFGAPYGQSMDFADVELRVIAASHGEVFDRTVTECAEADAQLSALADKQPLPEDPDDDELQRLRRENADLQGALGRVQHVAEDKARYWEIRCEYAEVALADLGVYLQSAHDRGVPSQPIVFKPAIMSIEATLKDRAERGIEDLEKTLRDRRQVRILDTARRLWGANADVDNIVERVIRFYEEATELLQAVFDAYPEARRARAADGWFVMASRIIGRAVAHPPGDPASEAAGCYFTLAAFCEAAKLSGQELEVREAIRVSNLDPAAAAAKHQSKIDEGI